MGVDRQESLPSSVEQFGEGYQSGMFEDVAKVADVGERLVPSHFGSECALKASLTSRALVVTLLTCPCPSRMPVRVLKKVWGAGRNRARKASSSGRRRRACVRPGASTPSWARRGDPNLPELEPYRGMAQAFGRAPARSLTYGDSHAFA